MLDKSDLRVSYTTDDWKYVKLIVEGYLKNAREMIEQKSTGPEDTAFYRGRITLAKDILKLPELKELTPANPFTTRK